MQLGLLRRDESLLHAVDPPTGSEMFLWSSKGELQYDRSYQVAKEWRKKMPWRQNAVYFWLLAAAQFVETYGASAVGGGWGHRHRVLSIKYIATGLGFSRPSVRKYLRRLVDLGLIKVNRHKTGIAVLVNRPASVDIWQDRQRRPKKASLAKVFDAAPQVVPKYKNYMWRELDKLAVPENGKGGIVEILKLSESSGWDLSDWERNLNECDKANRLTADDRRAKGQRAINHPGYLMVERLRKACLRWASLDWGKKQIWCPSAKYWTEKRAEELWGDGYTAKLEKYGVSYKEWLVEYLELKNIHWFQAEQDLMASAGDLETFKTKLRNRAQAKKA